MNRFAHSLLGLATATGSALTPGCAVTRGQEAVRAYVDDAAITTAVKARLLDKREVDGTSISVEMLNATVMLSGFARSAEERDTAESVTRLVNGAKYEKNEIAMRP